MQWISMMLTDTNERMAGWSNIIFHRYLGVAYSRPMKEEGTHRMANQPIIIWPLMSGIGIYIRKIVICIIQELQSLEW